MCNNSPIYFGCDGSSDVYQGVTKYTPCRLFYVSPGIVQAPKGALDDILGLLGRLRCGYAPTTWTMYTTSDLPHFYIDVAENKVMKRSGPYLDAAF